MEEQSRRGLHHNGTIDGVELGMKNAAERYVGVHSGVHEELRVVHLVDVVVDEGRERQTVFVDHVFCNGVVRLNIAEDRTHLVGIHTHVVNLRNRSHRSGFDVRAYDLDCHYVHDRLW